MGLRDKGFPVREFVAKRFVPDDPQVSKNGEAEVHASNYIRNEITKLAVLINEEVAGGRETSLALTHLEEALMWTNKAIFKED